MHWKIKNPDLSQPFLQRILWSKGLETSQQISDFLNDGNRPFHDPFLLKDMEKAVTRIKKAIEKKERIIVYGDYDVDGISGTALLIRTLEKLGAIASYRVPHRLDDGYGLHQKFIEEFATINIALVITVDCGISCAPQITDAKKKGIDVIITDHHTMPENFPHDAVAVLHPLQPDCPYPFKGLTGSGVAFKLADALLKTLLKTSAENANEDGNFLESLTDLACFGTIADLGPLTGENRTLVIRGLRMLQKTRWKGLAHLIERIQKKSNVEYRHPLDTSLIGFGIGPRINAAGRIAHPYLALQLLLQEDEKKSALLAKKLDELNETRRTMTEKACEEAEKKTEEQKKNNIFILNSPGWHTGILGLIAAKMSERHHRPIIALQDRGDFLVASARTPKGYDIMQLLNKTKNFLDTFGGHPQAAGFTIRKKNFQDFCEKMQSEAQENEQFSQKFSEEKVFEINCEIQPHEMTIENAEEIEKLQPFGIGNEAPIVAMENVTVEEVRAIGKNGDHLKMTFRHGHEIIGAIGFGKGRDAATNATTDAPADAPANSGINAGNQIKTGKIISIAGHLEKNVFRNKVEVQVRLVDWKFPEM